MARKGNSYWKLKLFVIIALFVSVYCVIKTQTTWLSSETNAIGVKKNEAYYIQKISAEINGKTEVRVDGGRADIVTKDHAIEVEWASKWKEAIGQALWYGLQTGKTPKIILLMKNKKKDYKYFVMLNSALDHGGIKIETEARYVNE